MKFIIEKKKEKRMAIKSSSQIGETHTGLTRPSI